MLLKEWCDTYFSIKKNKVKTSTYQNKYYYNYRRYIKPSFGDRELESIKPFELELFFYSDEIKVKSSAVKQKLYSLLYGIFQKALDNDLLHKNPVAAVELPKYQIVKPKGAYNQQQADLLYEFCKTHRFGAPVALMLKAGLRRGEVLGLRYNDLDVTNNLISIVQAVVEQGGRGVITTPKTDSSVRILPVSSELISLCLQKASEGKGNSLLFANRKGEALSPHNWYNRQYVKLMNDFLKQYPDVPFMNPHELRHTCGTLLYRRGVDIRSIQKYMGHSSVEITSSIYIHDDVEQLREALEGVL